MTGRHRAPEDVTCPLCDAAQGSPCTTHHAVKWAIFDMERIDAAAFSEPPECEAMIDNRPGMEHQCDSPGERLMWDGHRYCTFHAQELEERAYFDAVFGKYRPEADGE